MKGLVIAIPFFVITMIAYALSPIFFEMSHNAFGEGVNLVSEQNVKTFTYSQQQPQIQLVEKDCNSPCPESAEMCIATCA